jgi:hypothetical protein
MHRSFQRWRAQHRVKNLKAGGAAASKRRVSLVAEGSKRFPCWCAQQNGASSLFLSTQALPCSCCW